MLAVSALALMSIQHGHLRFAVKIGLDVIEYTEREGAPLADLLRLYLDKNGELDYALTLIGACPVEMVKLNLQPAFKGSEPLSGRELEVLLLMAQGMKYKEIADKLIVSVNTVRFHIKKIYAKLQVNNRTEAIEASRKLKLI